MALSVSGQALIKPLSQGVIMEITIANPYKGRLETVNIEFSDKNTSYISDKEKTVSITDYHDCLIIDEGLGTYPVIVYGLSRSDIAGDIQKLLQLKEETLNQWGVCDPPAEGEVF